MRKRANKKDARGFWVVPCNSLPSLPTTPSLPSSLPDEAWRANAKPRRTKHVGITNTYARARACMHERQKNIYGRCRGTHCYKLTAESLESSVSLVSPPLSSILSLPLTHIHTHTSHRSLRPFPFPSQLLTLPSCAKPNLTSMLSIPCYSLVPPAVPSFHGHNVQDTRTLSPFSCVALSNALRTDSLAALCSCILAFVSASGIVCELSSPRRILDNVGYVLFDELRAITSIHASLLAISSYVQHGTSRVHVARHECIELACSQVSIRAHNRRLSLCII